MGEVAAFITTTCPICVRAVNLFDQLGRPYALFPLNKGNPVYEGLEADASAIRAVLAEDYQHRTVPAIFIKGNMIGGYSDLAEAQGSGRLAEMLGDDSA